MSNPVVTPINPLDNTSYETSIHGEYKLQLDDLESSINVSTLNIQGYYGSIDEREYSLLEDKVIGNFRDTGANPTLSRSVDIVQHADKSLEFTVNQADAEFNSALFFPTANKSTSGIGFSVTIDVNTFSTVAAYSNRPYYQNSNFTGVSFGLYDFKRQIGIVIFLNDSGNLEIAGPASDGTGTRVGSQVAYAWVSKSTYSILINYDDNLLVVTATTDESGADTVLYSGSLSVFGGCLSSVAMGGRTISESDDVIAFVSQDGREIGDVITVENFSVFPTVYRLVSNGSFTPIVSTGFYNSRDSIISQPFGLHTLRNWDLENVNLYKSDVYDATQFEAAAGYVKSEFLDVQNLQFFISVSMLTTENMFAGVNSGIGIDIIGNRQISIRYLDGRIALRIDNNIALIRSLAGYVSYAVDLQVVNDFIFCCDGTTVYAYIKKSGSYVLMFSHPVAGLPSASGNHIAIVSETGLSGILFTKDLVISPTAFIGILPSVNNTTAVTGSYTYPITAPVTTTNTKFVGSSGISASYLRIPKYLPDYSGIVCVTKFTITPANVMQPGAEIGPFILLNTDTPTANTVIHSLRVSVTKGNDGKLYLFFPGDAQDVREVAYQTNKGKSISTEILDLSMHLCFRYSPFEGLNVFDVNDNMRLIKFIPKVDIDGSHMILPNPNNEGVYLPVDVSNDSHFTAGVGVLDISSHQLDVEILLVGVGRGTELSILKDENKIPTNDIYGNRSRILVRVEDND